MSLKTSSYSVFPHLKNFLKLIFSTIFDSEWPGSLVGGVLDY